MRVITGKAKGKRLTVPEGRDIRPVTDMIKQAIFNVIGPYFDSGSFLDVYAGSGSMAIEALSRGMDEAVIVEIEPHAVKIIQDNLLNCRLEKQGKVYKGDACLVLKRLTKQGKTFDCVFVDPPFRKVEESEALSEHLPVLVKDDGVVIIRTPARYETIALPGLSAVKVSEYGDSVVHFYRK